MTTPLFFLHIPKNSGTTLNQIVRKNYHAIFKVSWDAPSPRHAMSLLAAGDAGVFGDTEVVSGRYPWGLHRVLGEATDARYMTMLREPLARSLSGYNYLRSDSKYVRKNPSLKRKLEWSSVLYLRARVGATPKQVLTEAEQPVLQARNALDLALYRYGLELFAHRTATIDAAAIDAFRKALEPHARIQSVLRRPLAAAGRLHRALGRV